MTNKAISGRFVLEYGTRLWAPTAKRFVSEMDGRYKVYRSYKVATRTMIKLIKAGHYGTVITTDPASLRANNGSN